MNYCYFNVDAGMHSPNIRSHFSDGRNRDSQKAELEREGVREWNRQFHSGIALQQHCLDSAFLLLEFKQLTGETRKRTNICNCYKFSISQQFVWFHSEIIYNTFRRIHFETLAKSVFHSHSNCIDFISKLQEKKLWFKWSIYFRFHFTWKSGNQSCEMNWCQKFLQSHRGRNQSRWLI